MELHEWVEKHRRNKEIVKLRKVAQQKITKKFLYTICRLANRFDSEVNASKNKVLNFQQLVTMRQDISMSFCEQNVCT